MGEIINTNKTKWKLTVFFAILGTIIIVFAGKEVAELYGEWSFKILVTYLGANTAVSAAYEKWGSPKNKPEEPQLDVKPPRSIP